MQITKIAVAIAALSLTGTALAHEPGSAVLRVGVVHVAPDSGSSTIKLNGAGVGKATVKDNTQLGLTATYIVAPHFGVELLAATPFKHTIKGKVPALAFDGTVGTTKHLPPTLSAQYFPLDSSSKFQPYVGLGLNYTWFFSEHAKKSNGFSNLDLENSFGLAYQLGADYQLTDRLAINAAVWKIDIDTKATVNAPVVGKVKANVAIDPWVYFVGVGYKF